MTQVPQEEIKATDFTPAERRLMRLLAMLPAPHSGMGDQIDADKARRFWDAMSEHLGARRNPSGAVTGAIAVPAMHAGALMEEGISRLRQVAHKHADAREEEFTILTFRSQASGFARRVFSIFGDLSDYQRAILGEALGSARPHAPKGFVDEWLRQLHETAMNVIVENSPLTWDLGSELAYLDRVWGHPDTELGEFFPHNLEGFGVKELVAKARPVVKATDNRFEVWQENVSMAVLRLRTHPDRPCFAEEDFKSGLVQTQARKVLSELEAAGVHISKEALALLLDRRPVKLM